MVTRIFTWYTHVYMKELNCGYICWVGMDTKVYTYGDVYIESILVYCFHCVLISLLLGWAAMNLFASTLTMQHVARLDTYMREHMYATVYVARILNFSKIREDVQNVHASCSLMPLHFCITPSLIFNYSIIYFSSCKIILSHPNCNVTTDGRTSTTA